MSKTDLGGLYIDISKLYFPIKSYPNDYITNIVKLSNDSGDKYIAFKFLNIESKFLEIQPLQGVLKPYEMIHIKFRLNPFHDHIHKETFKILLISKFIYDSFRKNHCQKATIHRSHFSCICYNIPEEDFNVDYILHEYTNEIFIKSPNLPPKHSLDLDPKHVQITYSCKLQNEEVQSEDNQTRYVPIEKLYYDAIKKNLVFEEDTKEVIDYIYCKNCKKQMNKRFGGRCTDCFDCPICSSTLLTQKIVSGHCVFYCSYCKWNSSQLKDFHSDAEDVNDLISNMQEAETKNPKAVYFQELKSHLKQHFFSDFHEKRMDPINVEVRQKLLKITDPLSEVGSVSRPSLSELRPIYFKNKESIFSRHFPIPESPHSSRYLPIHRRNSNPGFNSIYINKLLPSRTPLIRKRAIRHYLTPSDSLDAPTFTKNQCLIALIPSIHVYSLFLSSKNQLTVRLLFSNPKKEEASITITPLKSNVEKLECQCDFPLNLNPYEENPEQIDMNYLLEAHQLDQSGIYAHFHHFTILQFLITLSNEQQEQIEKQLPIHINLKMDYITTYQHDTVKSESIETSVSITINEVEK
mmetsp:Transcript_6330/g.9216  ORF Transcript_6330/g.9216 Transcript_6330/m.9216 type:complete len:578 (+) Transcript_6330:14-1747(+)